MASLSARQCMHLILSTPRPFLERALKVPWLFQGQFRRGLKVLRIFQLVSIFWFNSPNCGQLDINQGFVCKTGAISYLVPRFCSVGRVSKTEAAWVRQEEGFGNSLQQHCRFIPKLFNITEPLHGRSSYFRDGLRRDCLLHRRSSRQRICLQSSWSIAVGIHPRAKAAKLFETCAEKFLARAKS